MTAREFKTAINETKAIMDALMACVQDKSISVEDRNKYYAEYKQIAANYLKLHQKKPTLTIA